MGGRFDDDRMPFSFARALSWVSLALIFTSSIVLSVFISNNARETLLRKQQDFAILLAENLNHQIYRRFTLPTLVGFGRVALRQPVQYERLDQVIQSTIHGLHVSRLRIYDHSKVVSYSSDRSELGRTDLAPPDTDEALQGDEPSFDIVPGISFWRVMFLLDHEPGAYMLRTVYPLRIENRQNSLDNDGAVMGVLEFTQDITGDLGTVMRFQWLIVLTSLVSSVVLFSLLQVFIRRAERIFAERMKEKQRLERELHQHEKLASMGRVISSIAHEIRNPLGIIRSSAELLLKRANGGNGAAGNNGSGGNAGTASDAMSRRILGAIYDESMRLSQTVNDFLDYARPRKPREDSVDVDMVLDQVFTFLEPELARCKVEVTRETTPGLWTTGDKDLLYRAFYNIMVNGLQAMDGPGSITVRSAATGGGGDAPDGGELVVSFRDSGPGFDQNTRSKLLDPFFTTKENGTGLGLPIVNSIVTSHGGRLELANAPEGGAIVSVSLPARQPGQSATHP